MPSSAVVLLSLFLLLLPSSLAEIRTLEISQDSRSLIILEKFGFTHSGNIEINVSSFSVPPNTDPTLYGFFIISDESLLRAIYDLEQRQQEQEQQQQRPFCILQSTYVKSLIRLSQISRETPSYHFPVTHPDEYSLFFASCVRNAPVSMTVTTTLYNLGPDGPDFLSVGQSPVPVLYASFAAAYAVFLAAWLYLCLFARRAFTHKIHFLMAGLLLAKALNLLFAAEDQHYVRVTGTPHGWDVPFYLFQFLRGVLLFAVIVLVGTGWSFLKPFLQDREKKVLMVVIPLQVLANIASAVIGERGQSDPSWTTWTQLFLIVDIVCCCAVLFPIVWSIRSLKETSKTDGKAARNLAKLTLFRKFYVIVVGYLYFTRIVVYALKTITSYRYAWVSVAAAEIASLAFYVVMFKMFMPEERNQYFAIDDDEEEAAAVALREEEFEL